MSEKDPNVKLDAFCNPIVIGKTYGYTTSKNGLNESYIGTVTKINLSKVTIKVERRFISVYYTNMKEHKITLPYIMTVKASLLVPL
jgi:hypothetical protein